MTFTARLSSSAIRDLDRVPSRVAPAIIECIYGPLAQDPHRVGKPLLEELDGYWSARRGDYRILYSTDDGAVDVVVVRVGHRAHVHKVR
ncbi:MAG: type II toxin-antitoxin system RelE/ParE family toxin [Knoellia sp.]